MNSCEYLCSNFERPVWNSNANLKKISESIQIGPIQMLKRIGALIGLLISCFANAAIIDLG